MLPNNVSRMPSDMDAFMYRINVGNLRVEEYNFKTSDDAGWAADKARFFLSRFLRRKRPYNFPERIDKMSEHEMSCPSSAVAKALQTLRLDVTDETAPLLPTVEAAPTPPPAPPAPTLEEKIVAAEGKQSATCEARLALGRVQEHLNFILPILEESSVDLSRARAYRKFLNQLSRDAQMLNLASFHATEEINALKSQQIGYGKIEDSTPL